MLQFSIEDRFIVPSALTSAHNTLPKQSINVLNENCTEENQLIRLFLGTAVLVHNATGKRFIQKTNYSVIGCPIVNSKSYKVIEESLLAYDIEVKELDFLLRRTLPQRRYYKDLLSEVCGVLWRSQRGEYTLSFLHIYRFLEHVSFAFPLLYASRSSDYDGAFASLKEFFSNDKKELGFFKKFVHASIDSDLRSQTNKINFLSIDGNYRGAIYKSIKDQISVENITSNIDNEEIELKNDGILELCIGLRNRYFHFASTNSKNISNSDIGDSDLLFALVNKSILNWLTVIYFETIKHRIKIS